MPNQSHSGWRGIPWHRCDRCGFDFPVSELSRQDGLIVDKKCRDNPMATIGIDRRQTVIAQRLGDGQEEPALAEILKNNDDDISDY